jgi:hypothetical protein
METFSALKITDVTAIVQAVAVAATAIVAVRGINTWGREHSGKKRIDLAEEFLVLFFRVRDALSYIRSPDGFYHAGDPRGSSPMAVEYAARIPVERMNEHSALFADVRGMRYRMMALFGENAAQPLDMLDEILESINCASIYIGRNAEYERTHDNAADWSGDFEKWVRMLATHPDADPLKHDIAAMMKRVDDICRPAIAAGLKRY